MKKPTALIMAAVIAVSMAACGNTDKTDSFRDVRPDSQVTTAEDNTPQLSPTEKPVEPPVEKEPEPTPTPEQTKNGIRPEFKKAMDDYEAFFDKYIDFMDRYENASTTELMGLMAEYVQYMADFTEAMEALDEMENQEMSTEETLYYAQVTSRISQKLLAVA